MGRIKDLNSALPAETDAFAFDGLNGTKKLTYAEFKQKLIDDGFGSGSSEAVVLTQAEYNALPDDVKDSDTIFFISDAPFDLPNVVTCTAAEYAAMSDATKLDGRLYYVTDEEEVAKSLVVQTNVNSTETVPSSAVLYGIKSSYDTLLSNSHTFVPTGSAVQTYTANRCLYTKIGKLLFITLTIKLTEDAVSGCNVINYSDLGLSGNVIADLQFGLVEAGSGIVAKMVAKTNDANGGITCETLVGSFPSGLTIRGNIFLITRS